MRSRLTPSAPSVRQTEAFDPGQLQQTLAAVLDHSPMAIYLKDRAQRFLLANPETARIVGRPGEDLTGESLFDLYPTAIAAELADHDERVLEEGAPISFEETAPDIEGGLERTWLSIKFPVCDAHGETTGVGGISLDITEHKRAQAAQHAAEERFRVAFEQAAIPMALVSLAEDDRGRLIEANSAYAELLGRELEEIVGRRLTAWMHPDDWDCAFELPLRRLASGEVERLQFERRYLHADGHVVWTLVTDALYHDEAGRPVAIAQLLDISERKHFEGQLRHMADHDALTGLYNRRRFEEELHRALAYTRRFGAGGAVLILDLDGFKFVNDSLGHAAGDDLVTRLGGTLRRSLRETDVVARIGGDEFAVILPRTGETEAVAVAEKLLSDIRRSGTVIYGERHAQVTSSIGIAVFTQDDRLSAEDVTVEADIAMYDAKAAGKDTYAVYHRDEQRRERIAARQDWLTRLKCAIAEERFRLFAQPIVPICSNGLPRFELLLRMLDDDDELIPPGTFLYNAERFGLMEEIDAWVMSEAVKLLERYHACGQALVLAVNVSAKTLNAGHLATYLEGLLTEHRIPEGRLVIEITETAAISNIEQARDLARDVRALGCRLALDDFGAGFATFYYLKHLDFDYVKIDGEFIRHLPRNRADQLVVRSVVDIARGLGSDTVAEFVQDDETMAILGNFGVGYAQGYHTGRPGPLSQILPPLGAPRGPSQSHLRDR